MKQVEIQKRLRFRITKNGFLLDEQEGEFSEKILPWKEKFEADKWKALYGIGARFDENPLLFFELRGIDVGRFVDVTLANCVESMLENADAPSERIINDDHWEKLFGVL
ncbi:MAG: hypothetical protein PUG45_11915 [bacterium]|nr:hypothetical protein [bacterium]